MLFTSETDFESHSHRLASGVRNAEMKWSNPERLDMYGVRLIGWPEGIPAQNPSTLKVGQNKVLLEALQSGLMKFERSFQAHPRPTGNNLDGEDTNEDFSWAYDADAGSDSPPREQGTAASITPSSSKWTVVITPPHVPVISTNESAPESSSENVEFSRTAEADPALSTYREHYLWDEEGNGHVMDTAMRDEYYESNPESPPPQRPRKRPRSEEHGTLE